MIIWSIIETATWANHRAHDCLLAHDQLLLLRPSGVKRVLELSVQGHVDAVFSSMAAAAEESDPFQPSS